jgi:ketosteroid isomerase-like protein
VAERSRRRLEQQLVRFPRLVALLGRAIWRFYLLLPPRSPLRRAIVRRYTQQSAEAFNRGDLEATFAIYHPDLESILDPRLPIPGVEPVLRGREARVHFQERWNAEFRAWRWEPDEAIDLGDGRLLVVGRMGGSGSTSGAAVDTECGFLVTVSAGLVIREQIFLDRGEALEAGGLSK